MKKILVLALSLLLTTAVYADDGASVRINITHAGTNNAWFLCLPSADGCLSVSAGKSFPLNPGSVTRMILVNKAQMRMYPQPLPASCNIEVHGSQTLTVSGTIANNQVKQLRCSAR